MMLSVMGCLYTQPAPLAKRARAFLTIRSKSCLRSHILETQYEPSAGADGKDIVMTFMIGPGGLTPSPYRLLMQMTRIAVESQMIIGLRMAGMLGFMAQSPGEPFRMVAEKQAAASESLFAIAHATSRGESAERVLSAALRPYGKRTRANSRRLVTRR